MMTTSAATAILTIPEEISAGSVNTNATPSADAYATRWGIQCALPQVYLDVLQFGKGYIPRMEFFPIRSRNFKEAELFTMDEDAPRTQEVLLTAASAQQYVTQTVNGLDFGNNPKPGVLNYGLEVGFLGEDDDLKMYAVSKVLFPPLSRIREITEMLKAQPAIAATCPATSVDDAGVEREACMSCYYAWLTSDTCDAYLNWTAENGVTLQSADRSQQVKLTLSELETARNLAASSMQKGLAALRSVWRDILNELKKDGGRKEIAADQHNIRKDLHEAEPEAKQLQLMQAGLQGVLGQSAPSNPILEQVLAQNNQLIALMAKQMGITGVETVSTSANIPAPEQTFTEPAPAEAELISKNTAVIVEGKVGTVVGHPFGRTSVRFEDGETRTFDRASITVYTGEESINAAE